MPGPDRQYHGARSWSRIVSRRARAPDREPSCFGAPPWSRLVRIPLIRNILHINDTFPTAAVAGYGLRGVGVEGSTRQFAERRNHSWRRSWSVARGRLVEHHDAQNVEPVSISGLGLFRACLALPWGHFAAWPAACCGAAAAALCCRRPHADHQCRAHVLLLQPRPRGLMDRSSSWKRSNVRTNLPDGGGTIPCGGTQAPHRLEGIGERPPEVPVCQGNPQPTRPTSGGVVLETDVPAVPARPWPPGHVERRFFAPRTRPSQGSPMFLSPVRTAQGGSRTTAGRAFFVESVSRREHQLLRDVVTRGTNGGGPVNRRGARRH